MLNVSGSRPHVEFGQGRSATTLLTEDGCFYPVVSSLAYNDRKRVNSAVGYFGRGHRPMHRTTLAMAKPPWTVKDGYLTTSKQYHGGSKTLNPVRRPPACPSMHSSQIRLRRNFEKSVWDTSYRGTFFEKDIIPANRLHMASLVNRTDQTEGSDAKKVVNIEGTQPNYWSQYKRTHGHLGFLLGPGDGCAYPIRQSYHVLTGMHLLW
ncbi:hypothetical protein ScPMuIL_004893 [Solemya velum]